LGNKVNSFAISDCRRVNRQAENHTGRSIASPTMTLASVLSEHVELRLLAEIIDLPADFAR
jgi:hypothetical protein